MTRRGRDLPKRDLSIGIRVSVEEKAALQRAAYNDERFVSPLCRKILIGWLREHGYLPYPEGHEPHPKPAAATDRVQRGDPGDPDAGPCPSPPDLP